MSAIEMAKARVKKESKAKGKRLLPSIPPSRIGMVFREESPSLKQVLLGS